MDFINSWAKAQVLLSFIPDLKVGVSMNQKELRFIELWWIIKKKARIAYFRISTGQKGALVTGNYTNPINPLAIFLYLSIWC